MATRQRHAVIGLTQGHPTLFIHISQVIAAGNWNWSAQDHQPRPRDGSCLATPEPKLFAEDPSGDHHHAIRLESSRDLTFGSSNFLAAQTADMGGADRITAISGRAQRTNARFHQGRASPFPPRPQHGAGVPSRVRYADVVVVVAGTGLDGPQRSQGRTNQFGGGLPAEPVTATTAAFSCWR